MVKLVWKNKNDLLNDISRLKTIYRDYYNTIEVISQNNSASKNQTLSELRADSVKDL